MIALAKVMDEDPAELSLPQDLAHAVGDACALVSHNLAGQKLGRKGRITRERILAATIQLLDGPDDEPLTMSTVARTASLGMTSLYNYFTDLSELLLAVLDPVLATAEDAYLALLRKRWAEDDLGNRCYEFVLAFHRFWARHSRLLHMRNRIADQLDPRMVLQRVQSTMPIIDLLWLQMQSDESDAQAARAMATMVMTGIERSVTVATDKRMRAIIGLVTDDEDTRFVAPAARLLELAIRDARGTRTLA